jgi:hypothetical protein
VVAARKGWSGRKENIGRLLKFGSSVQRVQTPPDQSAVPQVGSEPCDEAGNRNGDA